MPHIIAHSYNNSSHPLFKKKGMVRTDGRPGEENSPRRDQDDKQKVPRSYESIKEAAGAKEQVQLGKNKNKPFF